MLPLQLHYATSVRASSTNWPSIMPILGYENGRETNHKPIDKTENTIRPSYAALPHPRSLHGITHHPLNPPLQPPSCTTERTLARMPRHEILSSLPPNPPITMASLRCTHPRYLSAASTPMVRPSPGPNPPKATRRSTPLPDGPHMVATCVPTCLRERRQGLRGDGDTQLVPYR